MAKKKTESTGPFKVVSGFDLENGERYEIGDTVTAEELMPGEIEALLEMDAIEEVK